MLCFNHKHILTIFTLRRRLRYSFMNDKFTMCGKLVKTRGESWKELLRPALISSKQIDTRMHVGNQVKISKRQKAHIFTHGNRHEVRKSMRWLAEWPLDWVTSGIYKRQSLTTRCASPCTWLTLIDLLFERQNQWQQINSLCLWVKLGESVAAQLGLG